MELTKYQDTEINTNYINHMIFFIIIILILHINNLYKKYDKLFKLNIQLKDDTKSIHDNIHGRFSESVYNQKEDIKRIHEIIDDLDKFTCDELKIIKKDIDDKDKEKQQQMDIVKIDIQNLIDKQKETNDYIAMNIVKFITQVDELEIVLKENTEKISNEIEVIETKINNKIRNYNVDIYEITDIQDQKLIDYFYNEFIQLLDNKPDFWINKQGEEDRMLVDMKKYDDLINKLLKKFINIIQIYSILNLKPIRQGGLHIIGNLFIITSNYIICIPIIFHIAIQREIHSYQNYTASFKLGYYDSYSHTNKQHDMIVKDKIKHYKKIKFELNNKNIIKNSYCFNTNIGRFEDWPNLININWNRYMDLYTFRKIVIDNINHLSDDNKDCMLENYEFLDKIGYEPCLSNPF